ncbi:DVU_1557 family redox protein [Zhenpiania hominis]|uniref:DVU_1557 family redox protein n=1 Tax=Zhenpiania hominis TaxID=2763644 RepID=UPI0039F5CB83
MSKSEQLLICGCCGQKLEVVKAIGHYLDYDFSVELMGCKHCNLVYIPEELANGRISQVESLLESK